METEAKASGVIPGNAEFFQDHFPGFPVLPGVLALDILKQAIERCLGKTWALAAIRNAKFSSYLKPGDSWDCEVKQLAGNEWSAKLFHQGRTAVSAKLIFENEK